MHETPKTRREVVKTLVAMAAGAALLDACGSEGGTNDQQMNGGTPDCSANGTAAAITSNHGHSLVVSKADVAAGVEKTYDITGSSSHPHTVRLSASQFAQLQMNQSVSATSSTDGGHSHAITVSCA